MPKKSIARRGIAHWQINKQGNGDHLLVFWKESIASITQANSDGLGPVGMGAHSEKKHWILSHYLYKHIQTQKVAILMYRLANNH